MCTSEGYGNQRVIVIHCTCIQYGYPEPRVTWSGYSSHCVRSCVCPGSLTNVIAGLGTYWLNGVNCVGRASWRMRSWLMISQVSLSLSSLDTKTLPDGLPSPWTATLDCPRQDETRQLFVYVSGLDEAMLLFERTCMCQSGQGRVSCYLCDASDSGWRRFDFTHVAGQTFIVLQDSLCNLIIIIYLGRAWASPTLVKSMSQWSLYLWRYDWQTRPRSQQSQTF